jgi:Spy/CpxP family protein refolding chaperone
MRLARLLACCAIVAAIALLSSDGIYSQEKTDAKRKLELPQSWSKLDLTNEQKAEILKLQDEHKQKVDELKMQIAKLDAELAKKRLALLTNEQRNVLRKQLFNNPDPKDKK